MTKFWSYVLWTVMSLAITRTALASDFSVTCSFKNDNLEKCASVISDIVSDKFIAKYPANRFQIFIHSNVMGYPVGGYSAYAIAGVIPRNSAHFPANRFETTDINGTDRKFSWVELANIELKVYRTAVQALMDQCEISPACDVYIARKPGAN